MPAPSFELARLVVNLVQGRTELEEAIDRVHKRLQATQSVGQKAILNEKLLAIQKQAAGEMQETIGMLTRRLLEMVGVEGAAAEGATRFGSSVLGATGAIGGLALAITGAVAAIGALVAIVTVATEKFVEWHDEMIRARSILHAFGGGSDSEMAQMDEVTRKLSVSTGENVSKLREMYVEVRKLTDQSSAVKIMNQSLALAAISNEPADRIAELVARIQTLGRDGPAALTQLRRLFSQLGPEFRDHSRQIFTVGQALEFIQEHAQKGAIAQAEQMGMISKQWAQFKNEIGLLWVELGKVLGPPAIGLLLGFMDALREVAGVFRTVLGAIGLTSGAWQTFGDSVRVGMHVQMLPLIGVLKVLATAFLSLKIAVEGVALAVLRLAQGLAYLVGSDETFERLGKAADKAQEMVGGDAAAIKELWTTWADPKAFMSAKAGLDISDRLTAKGKVGQPAEFSGLAEFWRKAQQNIFTGSVFDPAKAAKDAQAQRNETNALLRQVRDGLNTKRPTAPAVAA